ncbi:hypothetical protein LCGC14_3028870 [marine sediment metagenome]|uniref:NADPH-dependent FMN reductase-like domain-containing protein n=1 Tax=marine sediment metagenome TaxID=412755 RepID=A0A0F8WSV8_9ZZZZ
MNERKRVLAICGSASTSSANLAILELIKELGEKNFELTIFDGLSNLPHFRTELTDANVPNEIRELRNLINNSDALLVCTPEYVFSIPSGLKNALEWCVSTTILSDKPVGLITASASGEKGHEELKLIIETLQAKFIDETTLLIGGVRGKISRDGKVLNEKTKNELQKFVRSFSKFINSLATDRAIE